MNESFIGAINKRPQVLSSDLLLRIEVPALLVVTLLVLGGEAHDPGPAVLRPLQPVLRAHHGAAGGRHCIKHLTPGEEKVAFVDFVWFSLPIFHVNVTLCKLTSNN